MPLILIRYTLRKLTKLIEMFQEYMFQSYPIRGGLLGTQGCTENVNTLPSLQTLSVVIGASNSSIRYRLYEDCNRGTTMHFSSECLLR